MSTQLNAGRAPVRLRDTSIDDVHVELLFELDEFDRPWARSLRAGANRLYRIHHGLLLLLLISACWRWRERNQQGTCRMH
jgi:hypothetical protein